MQLKVLWINFRTQNVEGLASIRAENLGPTIQVPIQTSGLRRVQKSGKASGIKVFLLLFLQKKRILVLF